VVLKKKVLMSKEKKTASIGDRLSEGGKYYAPDERASLQVRKIDLKGGVFLQEGRAAFLRLLCLEDKY